MVRLAGILIILFVISLVVLSLGVKVNRSAVVGEGVVMGSGTNIEVNAHIERTIIGRNVHIGTGAFVSESHLWSNSRIEAGAHVKNAIVCDKAVVKKGAKVGR
jgi:ADP-glucose pyrophosphorylase